MSLNSAGYSLGKPFVELPSVESTNNYALAQVHEKLAQAGTCYFAHVQTAGRGQPGKTWYSEGHTSITMSIIAQPSFLQPREQFYLNACVSEAAYHFLGKYISTGLRIKWPNDLYWNDRKLGGILIENVIGSSDPIPVSPGMHPGFDPAGAIKKEWKWAIIGIGININQDRFDPSLKNPVSLRQITGKTYEPPQLARQLCERINESFHALQNGTRDQWLQIYNHILYKKDELVKFRKGNRLFEARVLKVDSSGRLIVKHGVEEAINFREVEWLI